MALSLNLRAMQAEMDAYVEERLKEHRNEDGMVRRSRRSRRRKSSKSNSLIVEEIDNGRNGRIGFVRIPSRREAWINSILPNSLHGIIIDNNDIPLMLESLRLHLMMEGVCVQDLSESDIVMMIDPEMCEDNFMDVFTIVYETFK